MNLAKLVPQTFQIRERFVVGLRLLESICTANNVTLPERPPWLYYYIARISDSPNHYQKRKLHLAICYILDVHHYEPHSNPFHSLHTSIPACHTFSVRQTIQLRCSLREAPILLQPIGTIQRSSGNFNLPQCTQALSIISSPLLTLSHSSQANPSPQRVASSLTDLKADSAVKPPLKQ